jgi:hypothetical protein
LKTERVDFENAMREVAREKSQVAWNDFLPDTKLRERAEELAREKFSLKGYNHKR